MRGEGVLAWRLCGAEVLLLLRLDLPLLQLEAGPGGGGAGGGGGPGGGGAGAPDHRGVRRVAQHGDLVLAREGEIIVVEFCITSVKITVSLAVKIVM